ncbi:hypothetical protein VWZ88_15280 [Phaeobacter sp. JH20_36]|uniref:hypothetical protein n=1 Tax=Phaeobacter TaxID=302485 RepID=UPI0021A61F20|nr:hypothetical protein [Phaeobacter inhibens]UWR93004.1 hypothetical protein K4K96_02820 [Phaeobacter inhibens]
MGEHSNNFYARLDRLERKHGAMARGYTAKVRADGLIVVAPRRVQSRISGRSLILFVAAFLLFKGFLMAALGFGSYDYRVDQLRAGTGLEKAGAFVMQRDPVSQFLAEKIGPVLR